MKKECPITAALDFGGYQTIYPNELLDRNAGKNPATATFTRQLEKPESPDGICKVIELLQFGGENSPLSSLAKADLVRKNCQQCGRGVGVTPYGLLPKK